MLTGMAKRESKQNSSDEMDKGELEREKARHEQIPMTGIVRLGMEFWREWAKIRNNPMPSSDLRISFHWFEFRVRTSWCFGIVLHNPRMLLDLVQRHSLLWVQFQQLEERKSVCIAERERERVCVCERQRKEQKRSGFFDFTSFFDSHSVRSSNLLTPEIKFLAPWGTCSGKV